MIKIENVVLPSAEQWRAIILGARNAMNSWDRSDSKFFEDADFDPNDYPCGFKLGSNDYNLLRRLAAGGSTHAKYRRMITVYANVTAPLYWWKEADTYRMGVEKNSCSTMHKIHAKEFTLEDFSTEHLYSDELEFFKEIIERLNGCRNLYLQSKNDESARVQKDDWWQMIQLLPSSYNQKRTVMLNYEVLANIYKSRKDHKLDEWAEHDNIDTKTLKRFYDGDFKLRDQKSLNDIGFCDWIKTLPYSELITQEETKRKGESYHED